MSQDGCAALRIIFAGTPEFARAALQRLHQAGHTVALVLTQPDRPAGRGMKPQASPVKQFALEHGFALAQPRSLRLDGKYAMDAQNAQQAIANAQADVMVVAAYGLILPQWTLDTMRSTGQALGCLNIHASLLPRWRGAAPIHRAIEAGDTHTGITIMQMDAGLDTGDMLLVQTLPIVAHDTTATLHDRLAALGADLIVQTLHLALQGHTQPQKQPDTGVCYAHKIEKHEALLDWRLPAALLERRVRAFDPFPGASTALHATPIKVWAAHVAPMPDSAPYGQVIAVSESGIVVATSEGALCLSQLQRPGGKRLAAADFVRGFEVRSGMQLELPAPAP